MRSAIIGSLHSLNWNNSLVQRLVKGGSWVAIGKIASMFTGVISNALLTRILSPEDVGIYFVALSVITPLAFAAQLGLGRTIIKLLGEARGQGRAEIASGSILSIIRIGFVAAIIVSGFSFLFRSKIAYIFQSTGLESISGIIAIAIIPFAIGDLLSDIFRGLQDFRLAEIFGGRGFFRGLLLSLGFVLALLTFDKKSNVQEVMIITLLVGIVTTVIGLVFIAKKINNTTSSSNDPSIKYILGDTWPVFLTNLVQTISAQSAIWILAAYRNSADVAIFGTVTKFVAFIAMPTIFYRQMVSPFISELYVQNKNYTIEKMLRTVANLTLGLALVFSIILIFRGGDLLSTVYGQFYAAGALALSVLVIGQLVNVGTGPCGQLLLMTGHQNLFFVISAVGGALSVLALFLMVRPFGYLGAAFGQSIFLIITNIALALIGYKVTGIRSWIGISRKKS